MSSATHQSPRSITVDFTIAKGARAMQEARRADKKSISKAGCRMESVTSTLRSPSRHNQKHATGGKLPGKTESIAGTTSKSDE